MHNNFAFLPTLPTGFCLRNVCGVVGPAGNLCQRLLACCFLFFADTEFGGVGGKEPSAIPAGNQFPRPQNPFKFVLATVVQL